MPSCGSSELGRVNWAVPSGNWPELGHINVEPREITRNTGRGPGRMNVDERRKGLTSARRQGSAPGVVIFSTRCVVSAAIKERGADATVLDLVATGHLALCVSEAILLEYQDVLLRPRLKLDPGRVRDLLNTVKTEGASIESAVRVAVSTDDADNRFLECAEEAGADFLITGNQRHFPRQWKRTRVVAAREFLELIVSGESE